MVVVKRLCEHEVRDNRAVEEVARQSRGAEVAEDVVLAVEAFGGVPVLEEVGQGVVVLLWDDGAQPLVDAPLVEFRGHPLIDFRRVAPPGAALLPHGVLVVEFVAEPVVAEAVAHTAQNVLCPQGRLQAQGD